MVKVQKKLQNYLILNKYLSSLFGFKDMEDFRRQLRFVKEGVNEHGKFHFIENLQTLKISNELKQKLNQYDDNIQEYLNQINQKRDPPIQLKYFQYLAILFTEIYLDRLFNESEAFYIELTNFVFELNKKEGKLGIHTYPYPNKNSMRKLAYWSATGSGKTLMMNINYFQICKYAPKDYDNLLLITPNEGLSAQHIEQLTLSSIENKKFEIQKTLEDWSLKNPVKVIEITKIKKEVSSQDGTTVPVEAFGKKNILFVDEGHKGHSTEARTWKTNREELVTQGGFTFEYSATFGEITGSDDTFNEYSSSILFDYRYKYFYEDGFGKDYNILNLKNKDDYGDEYFVGSLISLYEQKIYFKNYSRQLTPFNLENPLMIFVGSSVSGKKNDSDVFEVVSFISKFVNNRSNYKKMVEDILKNKSGLVDENEVPIFNTKFPYLREVIRNKTKEVTDIYDAMLKVLFHVYTSKTMQFVELKNAEGEIGLRFDTEYFGVINIGNTNSFLKLIEDSELNHQITKNNFEQSLFGKIEKKNSTINFLIGSKKFIEGWNSYRVSSMGLLNIGKQEGTQIIQLFGRGVRLKGYDFLLKRSYSLDHEHLLPEEISIPDNISILETLNIYGLNANYMAVFRETLKDDGIEEYEKIILKIKPNLPNTALYVPKLSNSHMSFWESVDIVNFKQKISSIKIDLSSKIDVLESDTNKLKLVHSDSPVKENTLSDEILSLLDYDLIYIELLKYKDLKKYANLFFTKENVIGLIKGKSYSILCKKELISLQQGDPFKKIFRIQEYTIQLLKAMLDKTYNTERYLWYQSNLDYEAVSEGDSQLIPKEYVFTINSDSKTLFKNIKDFTNQLRDWVRINSEDSNKIYEGDSDFSYEQNKILEFFSLNIHLFKPLIYKDKGEQLQFIKISPTNLVESERKFIKQLASYIESREDIQKLYLLRNPSRKGIGFFETKNFYPDFILWIFQEKKQHIVFIDPKGLTRIDPTDEKLGLYKEIKEIEKKLNKRTKVDIRLHSFILSDTEYSKLPWGESKSDLIAKNILFLEDEDEYLDILFNKVTAGR